MKKQVTLEISDLQLNPNRDNENVFGYAEVRFIFAHGPSFVRTFEIVELENGRGMQMNLLVPNIFRNTFKDETRLIETDKQLQEDISNIILLEITRLFIHEVKKVISEKDLVILLSSLNYFEKNEIDTRVTMKKNKISS